MDGDDVRLIRGDCLEAMRGLEAGSVDLIAADLPYGTTVCRWDTIVPLAPMWAAFKRILKPEGTVTLTASQPFTSMLVMSELAWFRWEDIWEKDRPTGSLDANRRPMRSHENILMFSSVSPTYRPQFTFGNRPTNKPGKGSSRPSVYHGDCRGTPDSAGRRFPRSVVKINVPNVGEMGLHPTQKPVALFEYLVLTYSDPGETVLDCTMGSGTTGVAAVNTGRRFIGIEQDPDYFRIASSRIDEARRPLVVGHPLSAHRRPRPAADRDPGQPTLFDSLS